MLRKVNESKLKLTEAKEKLGREALEQQSLEHDMKIKEHERKLAVLGREERCSSE